MGMNGMGWHHMHHGNWNQADRNWNEGEDGAVTPNQYYENRQSYHRSRNCNWVPGSGNNGPSSYDNDWRNNSGGSGSGYDDGNGPDDYSNQ
jgi:hypothetical protein